MQKQWVYESLNSNKLLTFVNGDLLGSYEERTSEFSQTGFQVGETKIGVQETKFINGDKWIGL